MRTDFFFFLYGSDVKIPNNPKEQYFEKIIRIVKVVQIHILRGSAALRTLFLRSQFLTSNLWAHFL